MKDIDLIDSFLASPILGWIILACLGLLALVLSAAIASIWFKLFLLFIRKTLDREYERMRGPAPYVPITRYPESEPRQF